MKKTIITQITVLALVLISIMGYVFASQHDLDITSSDANTGLTMRQQINAALQAQASNQSGTGDPGTTYPYQFKVDSSASPAVIYIRKSDNSAWVRWGIVNGTSGRLEIDYAFTAAVSNSVSPQGAGSGVDADTLDGVHASTLVPVGSIFSYGGTSAPSGWLLCNGSAVSRSTYSDLFSVIGEAYGVGDGSTTFNLPDLRGRYPLGADNMGGVSADRVTATEADNLGQGSGEESHTLTVSEMPSHTHTIKQYYENRIASSGGSETVHLPSGTSDTGSAGGDGAHNNMPPYQTVNYIIKH